MTFPWEDNEQRKLELSAETDEATDVEGLGSTDDEEIDDQTLAPADASGITSHVMSGCKQTRRYSKSTYKPPWTTDAVYARVAFYNSAAARLVLSNWVNLGSANPYQYFIRTWYYDNNKAVRALVLWNSNQTSWHRWASC